MAAHLVTERLRLRSWRETDKPAFASITSDHEVMHYFPSTLTGEQSDAMVDRMSDMLESRGWGLWAVERSDTDEFIGYVGLAAPTWFVDGLTPCVEIGWRLSKEHWGHGFAPEAAASVLQFAFEHVELPRDEVVSFTTITNTKSRRVMEKIGMQLDPRREFDHPMTPGWWGQRHVVYAIDRPTWKARVAR